MKKKDNLIKLAVTMGDPAGIGPELIIRIFKEKKFPRNSFPVIIGKTDVFRHYARLLSIDLNIREVAETDIASENLDFRKDTLHILEVDDKVPFEKITVGSGDKYSGQSAFRAVKEAIDLVKAGKLDAICTAPISKAALHDAEILFPGHTEILAHYSRTKNFAMLLDGGGIRVVLTTIHMSLKDAVKSISGDKILSLLRLMKKFFRFYGFENARIGVTGLNPHAGEGGLFGNEENRIIRPAVEKALDEKINASGPFPADTIFHRMLEGEFDAVLAMYHDQALIPVKTLDFHGGVNITMGLPFIRTSPDHGTAFDKAGKGTARPDSFIAALEKCCFLAQNKIDCEKK